MRLKLAVILLMFSNSVFADYTLETGNDFLQVCVPAMDRLNADDFKVDGNNAEYILPMGLCLGYYRGLKHSLYAMMGATNKFICTPDNVSDGQALSIIKKYINDNPAKSHELIYGLHIKAFAEAFPCKE